MNHKKTSGSFSNLDTMLVTFNVKKDFILFLESLCLKGFRRREANLDNRTELMAGSKGIS